MHRFGAEGRRMIGAVELKFGLGILWGLGSKIAPDVLYSSHFH
jgi:hypothetical protein